MIGINLSEKESTLNITLKMTTNSLPFFITLLIKQKNFRVLLNLKFFIIQTTLKSLKSSSYQTYKSQALFNSFLIQFLRKIIRKYILSHVLKHSVYLQDKNKPINIRDCNVTVCGVRM